MKTTLTILAILAVIAFANTTYAQEAPEQRVWILPTNLPGVIKLHYAMAFDEPLHVTFFNEEREVLGRDRIPVIENAQWGISKRYDIHKIGKHDFWMEIKTGKQSLVYHITLAKDRKHFSAVMEPASNQLLVKANN